MLTKANLSARMPRNRTQNSEHRIQNTLQTTGGQAELRAQSSEYRLLSIGADRIKRIRSCNIYIRQLSEINKMEVNI